MNLRKVLAWSCVLCLSALVARGQDTNQVEKIENQLKQLQEKFEKQQHEMRANFERMLREQQAQIEALKKQVEISKTNAPTIAQQPLANPVSAVPAPDLSQPWLPTAPIRIGSGQNYLNLSFDGLFAVGT